MLNVYYALLQKHYWHCLECLASAENLNYSNIIKINNIELFNENNSRQYIRNKISNNIRRIIKEKESSNTELAKTMGVSRSVLTNMLNSSNNTSISSFIRIGNALKVDFRRFFYDYKVNDGISESMFVKVSHEKIINKMILSIK